MDMRKYCDIIRCNSYTPKDGACKHLVKAVRNLKIDGCLVIRTGDYYCKKERDNES